MDDREPTTDEWAQAALDSGAFDFWKQPEDDQPELPPLDQPCSA